MFRNIIKIDNNCRRLYRFANNKDEKKEADESVEEMLRNYEAKNPDCVRQYGNGDDSEKRREEDNAKEEKKYQRGSN